MGPVQLSFFQVKAEVISQEVTWTGNDVTGNYAMYDVTGSHMTSYMTSLDAIVFPRIFCFSGILGYVCGCSRSLGCFGHRGDALVLGVEFGACASKNRPFSPALFGFSVFFVVSYGMFEISLVLSM